MALTWPNESESEIGVVGCFFLFFLFDPVQIWHDKTHPKYIPFTLTECKMFKGFLDFSSMRPHYDRMCQTEERMEGKRKCSVETNWNSNYVFFDNNNICEF